MMECIEVPNEEQQECLLGCSTYAQYYQARKNFAEKRCTFCELDEKINEVRHEAFGWRLWEVPQNFTTRKSTLRLQLVLAPKRHVRNPWNLNKDEQRGYFEMLWWANQSFAMPGGGIINRFGDMRYNVGTVMHMHATIMVPNREGSVIVPLQKNDATRAENEMQMRIFARWYEEGKQPEDLLAT